MKSTLTPEERKAAKSAWRKAYYLTIKDKPGFKKENCDRARRLADNSPWKSLVYESLKRAAAKGVPFDADLLEWAPTVWTGRCALSGLEFKRGKGSGPTAMSPSIDRILPALGYVKSNCRFILHGINALKSTGTDDEMWIVIRALVALHPA